MKKIAAWVLVGGLTLFPGMAFADVQPGQLITFGAPGTPPDGYNGIYSMNPDGSNREVLVDKPGSEYEAAISDDGKTLVYDHRPECKPDGSWWTCEDYDIFVRNLETGEERQLTDNTVEDHVWDISPDGSQIVFSRDNGYPNYYDLYVMNIDGSGLKQLTSRGNSNEVGARWSPDGSKIAYSAHDSSGNSQIYVMNADGTGEIQITNTLGNNFFPSWSKDGNKLVFSINQNKGIATINVDGTGYEELTTDGQFSYANDPKFSADGKTIVFSAVLPGNSGQPTLWSMNSDGTDAHEISQDPQFASDWLW